MCLKVRNAGSSLVFIFYEIVFVLFAFDSGICPLYYCYVLIRTHLLKKQDLIEVGDIIP